MLLLLSACGMLGREDVGITTSIDVDTTIDSEHCPEPSVCATATLDGQEQVLAAAEVQNSAHEVVEALACSEGICCTEGMLDAGSYVVVAELDGEIVAQPVLVQDVCETAWVELVFGGG